MNTSTRTPWWVPVGQDSGEGISPQRASDNIDGERSSVRATLHPKLYCAKGGVNWGTNQSRDKPQPQTAFSGRFFR